MAEMASMRTLPKKSIGILRDWMFSSEHVAFPYPTEVEKEQLMKKTGLTRKRLTNWFTNSRKRLWQPIHASQTDPSSKKRKKCNLKNKEKAHSRGCGCTNCSAEHAAPSPRRKKPKTTIRLQRHRYQSADIKKAEIQHFSDEDDAGKTEPESDIQPANLTAAPINALVALKERQQSSMLWKQVNWRSIDSAAILDVLQAQQKKQPQPATAPAPAPAFEEAVSVDLAWTYTLCNTFSVYSNDPGLAECPPLDTIC